MKILGKKQHPILGEIDDILIEESDFDFQKEWQDLDWNTKANFCSFMKQYWRVDIPFLNKEMEDKVVIPQWKYYQDKENATQD